MLTDIELQKKVQILTNKLKLGLFKEVIDETKLLLKKKKTSSFVQFIKPSLIKV